MPETKKKRGFNAKKQPKNLQKQKKALPLHTL